jgi:hypothetical protein
MVHVGDPGLFGQIRILESTLAERGTYLQSPIQIGFGVVTKSAGSEHPDFTSMNELFNSSKTANFQTKKCVCKS